MMFIKFVCRVPLRMTDEMCEIGDYAIHGEEPYTFEYYNRNYRRIAGYEHPGQMTDEEKVLRQVRASRDMGRKMGDGSSGDGSGSGVLVGQDPGSDISPVKQGKVE